jgi:hypothetical protein
MSNKPIARREDCSERQAICWDLIERWCGTHNVQRIQPCSSEELQFCMHTDISTYDCDGLTRLVLLAHAMRVRVELTGAGPNYLRVVLSAREPEGTFLRRHPGLTDLAQMAESEYTQTR